MESKSTIEEEKSNSNTPQKKVSGGGNKYITEKMRQYKPRDIDEFIRLENGKY